MKKHLRNLIKEGLDEACGIPAERLPLIIKEPPKKKIIIRILRKANNDST